MTETHYMFREIDGPVPYRPSSTTTTGKKNKANGENSTDQDEEICQSYTPASFDLLIPILQLKLDRVHLLFTNLPPDPASSDIHPRLQSICSLLAPWSGQICSSIIMTERELSFYSAERNRSLIVPPELICLHGLSNVERGRNQVYCQLDRELMMGVGQGAFDPQECSGEGETDEAESIELIITPDFPDEHEQSAATTDIFRALSHCACLHPTPMPKTEDPADKEDHHLLKALLEHDESPQLPPEPPADITSNRFQPY